MINGTCANCKKPVYLAVNERNGKTNEHYYSEVLVFRLNTASGGKPVAVVVKGMYEVHHCGGPQRIIRPTEKLTQQASRRGVTPAHLVRARTRKKFHSSGRE